MRKHRKLAQALAAMLSAGLFSAIPARADDPVSIKFVHKFPEEIRMKFFEEVVADFEAANPNIKIEMTAYGGEENSPLAAVADYSVTYGSAEPHDLPGIYLVGKIMKNAGDFPDYETFADQLANLGEILIQTARESEDVAEEYVSYFDPVDKEYQIWTGSGNTWGHTYSMAMCVLEECQWLRTKSVHSAEFFYGTLEMVGRNVLVCVGLGEGPTRPLDERVIRFAKKHTNQLVVFDTKTLSIPGMDEKYRWLLSPVLLWEMFARTYHHLADVRKHDMDIRAYYRRLEY